ncbi:MAG: small basic protein [Phycisphaeraceae bacterium]|nr:small basic protein [Phycisphaeraceae bacterium]
MSLDRSLKVGSSITKHRNVLTRAERIERLRKSAGFDMETGKALGLPKVGNRKVVTGAKSKKKQATDEAKA